MLHQGTKIKKLDNRSCLYLSKYQFYEILHLWDVHEMLCMLYDTKIMNFSICTTTTKPGIHSKHKRRHCTQYIILFTSHNDWSIYLLYSSRTFIIINGHEKRSVNSASTLNHIQTQ
eukprot:167982_1